MKLLKWVKKHGVPLVFASILLAWLVTGILIFTNQNAQKDKCNDLGGFYTAGGQCLRNSGVIKL